MQLRDRPDVDYSGNRKPRKTAVRASVDDITIPPPPQPKKRAKLEAAIPAEEHPEPPAVEKQPTSVLAIQNFANTMQGHIDHLKMGVTRLQNHGIGNLFVSNEFAAKMEEVANKTIALKELMPTAVTVYPIPARIQMTIGNCRALFAQDQFSVTSDPREFAGFQWRLRATTKNASGYLALFLRVEPPNNFAGNFRIEVDSQYSVSNLFARKDWIGNHQGIIYENDHISWGSWMLANIQDLMDPAQTFVNPEGGQLEVCVNFTIKSAKLNHLLA